MADEPRAYRPTFSEDHARRLLDWHEAAYLELRPRGAVRTSYLGLDLVVPEEVFTPTPVSDLLGRAVLEEVRPGERVLDMGTGCGSNAILAASRTEDVVGVDINPHAVAAAIDNAARNGVAGRTAFLQSDLFDAVEGTFDVIVFDPPFRWVAPRDLLERAMADEGYAALTRFMVDAKAYLAPGGRILLFFGTSGDLGYVERLIEANGLRAEPLGTRDLDKDDLTVTYFTWRLVPS